ncbi:MAG TPA: multicopper oxidase domain-containing protein [Nitrososphaeraceae archaeon]|nr:multicopper oxidase domain-containing protein [Nitrososphaeraceae archaeon]
MFGQNAYFFPLVLSIILIFSSFNYPFLNTPVSGQIPGTQISQEEYDKIKNCTTDLSKRPTPVEYLTYFNCGHVSKDESGKTIRQFTLIVEENQKIPVTYEGHILDAWTFNGTIPGPTIRVTEGDIIRIRVINSNENSNPHSLHTHSIHYAKNDGVSMGGYPGGAISPGRSFTYEFVAQPYGVYPYHCHVDPIADHINRGLYGMMIIDPLEPRPQMTEMAMLLNGYDLDLDLEGPTKIPPAALFQTIEDSNMTEDITENETSTEANMTEDITENETSTEANTTLVSSDMESADTEDDIGEDESSEVDDGGEDRVNEIYTVNGKAFDYMMNPIVLQTGKPYRIFLVNMLEFDLVNSFHLHGAMFNYYTAGTDETADYSTDIVTLSQGDRGIMEFTYAYPGTYMFHAHQTEFTDLGWMGLFDVRGDPVDPPLHDAT